MTNGRHFLFLFGHPALHRGDEALAFPQKAFLLAALLQVLPDRRAPRALLAAWMYEEASQAGALANLRQLLSRIQTRQAELGLELFAISRGEVRLSPGDAVECDLDRFERLEAPGSEAELSALARLYRGELLEGLSGCAGAPSGSVEAHRERLRERFVELTISGARRVRGRAGEEALKRLVALEPYREEVWRALIELIAEGQGAAAGEAVYEEMRRRFALDLGTAPDARTAALAGSLRRKAAEPLRAPAESGPDAPGPHPPSPSALGPGGPDRAAGGAPRLCLLMPRQSGAAGEEGKAARFAAALLEDVTLGLCRLRSIAVIAPHTAWHLAGGTEPPEAFNIGYVGETSVSSFAGRTRLVVTLVRARDRLTLWSEDYDLVPEASAEHHRELSQSIMLALADGVERAEFARFERLRDPSAYRLYLSGREHMRVFDLPSMRRARRVFTESVEVSPVFGPALNGIARTLILEWFLVARTEPDRLLEARDVARRSVALDPFSGEALRELANAQLFLGRLDEALDGLARAERLAPHHADILADYADALTHSSDLVSALQRVEKGIALNPLPPDDYLWKAAGALFLLERYDEALSYLRRMRQPEAVHRLTAACLAMAGKREEAKIHVAKAMEDQPNFKISDWIATIPLRSKDHRAHYAGALREAGFR